jgi:integrase
LREDTLRGYRHHLNNSFAGLRERMLSDITPAEIDALLAERPPSSKRAAQIILGVLWRWAASPPRIWCKVDVIDALEPVRISRETEIVCLSPEAAAALLRAAENTSPGCAVGFAVAIFGGVRLRELGKLTWKNIGETHIEVGADIAKRHARRLIPICPTLKAWLGTYRGGAEAEDRIVGPNWVNTSKTARRMAGWDLQSKAKNPPLPHRGAWPGNCMRHTCASIQVAIGRPLDDLIFAFGHSGGSHLLKQHYLARLTKKEALAILAIGPGGKKIETLNVA